MTIRQGQNAEKTKLRWHGLSVFRVNVVSLLTHSQLRQRREVQALITIKAGVMAQVHK